MTTVTILRDLWRRRVTVSLLALLSVVVGVFIGYEISLPLNVESRTYPVAIASARVLLDTPSSQIVDVAPKGSESLGERANLLANLMTDGELKSAIAQRAALKPDELLVVAAGAIAPTTFSERQLKSPRAKILTTEVLTDDAGAQLPIIDLKAQAPDPQTAAALANAAATGLREFLDSKAAAAKIPDARRLRLSELGSARVHGETRGPTQLVALAVAIVLFAILCAALVALSALSRTWRETAQEERDSAVEAVPGTTEYADDLLILRRPPHIGHRVERDIGTSAAPPAIAPPPEAK